MSEKAATYYAAQIAAADIELSPESIFNQPDGRLEALEGENHITLQTRTWNQSTILKAVGTSFNEVRYVASQLAGNRTDLRPQAIRPSKPAFEALCRSLQPNRLRAGNVVNVAAELLLAEEVEAMEPSLKSAASVVKRPRGYELVPDTAFFLTVTADVTAAFNGKRIGILGGLVGVQGVIEAPTDSTADPRVGSVATAQPLESAANYERLLDNTSRVYARHVEAQNRLNAFRG